MTDNSTPQLYLPISVKITLIILLSLLLQSSMIYWFESKSIKADLLSEYEHDVRAGIASLQQTLEFLAQKNEHTQLQATITALGSDARLNAAYLLDENLQVIASTRITSRGHHISTLLAPSVMEVLNQHLSTANNTSRNALWQSPSRDSLYLTSPIVLGKLSENSLRLDKVGLMLQINDLKWIEESVNQSLFKNSIPMLIIMLVFTLLLIMYFHYAIGRRIRFMHNTTAQFVLDKPYAEVQLSGNDELSDLHNLFNNIISQIVNTHRELAENERRLNKTQELAHLGSWDLDLINNHLSWSDEVYRIFGLTPQEFPATYEAFLEAVHPDDRDKVNNAYSGSIQQGTDEYQVEHRVVQKNTQQIREVFEKCHHVRDASGKIIRSIGMVHDITERKQAEQAWRQSQLQFKNIIDASPVPYALNDTQQNITYLNPAFINTFGYDLTDIPTLSDWWPKAYPDVKYRDRIASTWQQHLVDASREKTAFKPLEIEVCCKDGSRRIILASAAPLHQTFNDQHLVILYDITERKQIEQQLRDQQEEQQQILNNMVDAVISIDERGTIQTFNPSAQSMFGFDCDEVIGKNIKLLMPTNYASNHDGYLSAYMQTNIASIIGIGREVSGQRKNGQVFPMRLSVAELPKAHDGSRRFIGTIQDISQQKHQEELLHQSQKMEALGKLTGGIAHDFNNILGVILGYSELLKKLLAETPKQSQYISEIYNAGERAKKLTTKLLAFSRKKAAAAETVDINQLLNDEQHLLEKTLTARINLTLDLEPVLWPVWLDKSSLEDAILNMSINSMHAMSNGGDFVIKTKNVSLNTTDSKPIDLTPGDYVVLSLSDTGIGMDNETRQRIFEPFFTTKADGTGLGMSQVYGFVQQSQGIIQVYSEPGNGTRIEIYFPRHHDNQEQLEEQILIDDNKLTGSETILVVDDEPSLVTLAREILSNNGYKVLSANSGAKALEILKSEKVDVLLTDIIMPEMDGYQLSAQVQKLYPQIKIQLVSGYSDQRHSHLISNELHQQKLQKPFDSTSLLVKIRELLNQAR